MRLNRWWRRLSTIPTLLRPGDFAQIDRFSARTRVSERAREHGPHKPGWMGRATNVSKPLDILIKRGGPCLNRRWQLKVIQSDDRSHFGSRAKRSCRENELFGASTLNFE